MHLINDLIFQWLIIRTFDLVDLHLFSLWLTALMQFDCFGDFCFSQMQENFLLFFYINSIFWRWQVTLLKVTSPLLIKNFTAGLHVSGKLSQSATEVAVRLQRKVSVVDHNIHDYQNMWMLQSYENRGSRIWDGVIVMVLIHLGNEIVFKFLAYILITYGQKLQIQSAFYNISISIGWWQSNEMNCGYIRVILRNKALEI